MSLIGGFVWGSGDGCVICACARAIDQEAGAGFEPGFALTCLFSIGADLVVASDTAFKSCVNEMCLPHRALAANAQSAQALRMGLDEDRQLAWLGITTRQKEAG